MDDQTKVKSYRSFDAILQRWFSAPTEEALAALLNLPQFINLRVQRQARWAREAAENERWSDLNKASAEDKRARKQAGRKRDAQHGGYHYHGFNQHKELLSA
jgi:hypothetical protein